MDKVTHILSFCKCKDEKKLNSYCDDLVASGGKVFTRSIKEEENVGFCSVTMDKRDEIDFWLAFKKTDSYKFMD